MKTKIPIKIKEKPNFPISKLTAKAFAEARKKINPINIDLSIIKQKAKTILPTIENTLRTILNNPAAYIEYYCSHGEGGVSFYLQSKEIASIELKEFENCCGIIIAYEANIIYVNKNKQQEVMNLLHEAAMMAAYEDDYSLIMYSALCSKTTQKNAINLNGLTNAGYEEFIEFRNKRTRNKLSVQVAKVKSLKNKYSGIRTSDES